MRHTCPSHLKHCFMIMLVIVSRPHRRRRVSLEMRYSRCCQRFTLQSFLMHPLWKTSIFLRCLHVGDQASAPYRRTLMTEAR